MIIDFKTNKSICGYPWIHSYLGCKYERKLCCISDDIIESEKTTTKEFWNSDYMKNIRLKMMNGDLIDECSVCYMNEKKDVASLRQESMISITESTLKSMTEKTNSDGSLNDEPVYFDYRTIHCNLQCLSCGVVYSSKHIGLQKTMWGGNQKIFISDKVFEKEMADEIIESLRNKVCTTIYWAGGEPMISPIHWAVLEEMIELRKDKNYTNYIDEIGMHYNTNLTQLNWKSQSIPEILKFNQPSIQASLDGTHETIEYTRDGCKWEDIKRNWIEYNKVLNKNNQMGIASVLTSPVIMDIDRWFDFYEPYNPMLFNHRQFTNLGGYPTFAACFLDVRLFPQHIFDRIMDHAIYRFENCKLANAGKTISILNSYKKEKKDNAEFLANPKMLEVVKKRTLYRDKFLITKRTYAELLKIIDEESYDWYMSIK
jgi:organic radical activating enzyme